MSPQTLHFAKYMAVSYIAAISFETLANTVGDGTLFTYAYWPIVFFLWYGLIYSVLYIAFHEGNPYLGAIVFGVFGVIAEIFVFHRTNPPVDFCIYFLMALIPLWTARRAVRLNKDQMK